jgi:hypothetical protein
MEPLLTYLTKVWVYTADGTIVPYSTFMGRRGNDKDYYN